MSTSNVCLQINLAPGDVRYVSEILPHQLRVLGRQVEEIQFTVDTRQSRAFRSATETYSENLATLRKQLTRFCEDYPTATVVEVDYSQSAITEVAKAFMADRFIPLKACDGSAFYAYLYGIYRTKCDFVFHIDSDMLFGGGSQVWLDEALEILTNRREVLACYPFPGPPRSDGKPSRRRLTSLWDDVSLTQKCVASDTQYLAYAYNEVSTRALLFDKRRFGPGQLQIPLVKPKWRRLTRSFWINTPPYLLLEDCITILMNREGLYAVGFLGSDGGLWSLHPRWRTNQFYAELRNIVRRVEKNDVPDHQRGDFDINASLVDLSEVRRQGRRWSRFWKEIRLAAFGIADRLSGN